MTTPALISLRLGLLLICLALVATSVAIAETPCLPNVLTVPAIRGHVYFESKEERKPLADITIKVIPSSGHGHTLAKTRTAKDGRFEFHNIKPGDYYVSIDHKHKEFAGILIDVQVDPQEAANSDTPEFRIVLRNNYFQSCSGSYAEIGSPAGDQNILLSIYTDNSGMVNPSGRFIYAVIRKDGQMTYADMTYEHLLYKKRALNKVELTKLLAAIDNEPLLQLKGKMSPQKYHLVDYHIVLLFEIARDSARQEFALSDFARYVGDDYPPAAKSLLCLVDELCGSKYRLSEACD